MFEEPGFAVFLVVLATSALKHLALAALPSQFFARRRPKERAGRLSRITIYPVKSMKGVDVQSAECEYTGPVDQVHGLLKDRVWLVVTEKGNFMTARQKPKLVLIEPSFHGNMLHLDAVGMETLKLPASLKVTDGKVSQTKVWGDDMEGIDCGDEAAKWLSTYLETPGLRLLYHAEGMANRKLQNGGSKWHKTANAVDQVAFQDAFPFMLMTDSSVEDLNEKLMSNQVSARNFRPNFLVSTSFPPFNEDNWVELFIGDAIFRNIKPCDRCMLTTVDPETGIMDDKREPLVTLRTYRLTEPEFGKSPVMGINLVLIQPGTVRVGDEVYVRRIPA